MGNQSDSKGVGNSDTVNVRPIKASSFTRVYSLKDLVFLVLKIVLATTLIMLPLGLWLGFVFF